MPHKVLLIDDEVGFTELLKMNLERSGEYEVRIENDPTKSLEVAKSFQPDVILLDLVMPSLDGAEVAARLEQDQQLSGVPVIMLTALLAFDVSDPEAAVRSGAKVVLPKPINTDVLRRFIGEAIGAAVVSP